MKIQGGAFDTLALGSLTYDVTHHELKDASGKRVHLRAQAAQVLAVLVAHAPRIVARETLIEQVWGNIAVTDDSLTQCIAEIRRVFGKDQRALIKTVPKRGFFLDVEGRSHPRLQAVEPAFVLALRDLEPARLRHLEQSALAPGGNVRLLGHEAGIVLLGSADARALLQIAEGGTCACAALALSASEVDVAKCLTRFATPGQILATIDAWTGTELGQHRDIEDVGELSLLNNTATKRVLRILPRPPASLRSFAASPEDPRPTLTILPPLSVIEDRQSAVLSAVIADELTASLAAASDITLTSRLSAAAFCGPDVQLKSIGKATGAKFVLSGSFRHFGDDARISLEFSDVRSQQVLWYETLTCAVPDLLRGQSPLDEVASKVRRAIVTQEVRKIHSQPLETLENFGLLFGAIGLMHRLSIDDFLKARRLLEALDQRISHQPIVLAWLARWYILRVYQGWSDDALRDAQLALDCTKRALDLEPENTQALASEGHVLTNLHKRFDLAEDRFENALSLNPNDAVSHLFRGTFFAFQGKGEEAERDASRALQLSPFDPHRFYFLAHAAGASLAANNTEHALELARQSLRLNSTHASTQRIKTVAHVRLGQMDKAREAATKLLALQPDLRASSWLKASPSGDFEIGKAFAREMVIAGIPE